jgi:hypothetical protein
MQSNEGAEMISFRLIKQPSAFVPLLMSFAALVVVIGFLAIFGIAQAREPHDEGAAAHTLQLLMFLQIPVGAFFAIKWLPRSPKDAWPVVVLQILAWLAAAAPVFLLDM